MVDHTRNSNPFSWTIIPRLAIMLYVSCTTVVTHASGDVPSRISVPEFSIFAIPSNPKEFDGIELGYRYACGSPMAVDDRALAYPAPDAIDVVLKLTCGNVVPGPNPTESIAIGWMSPGQYKIRLIGLVRESRSAAYGAPQVWATSTFAVTRYAANILVTVIEFYNASLKHYFLTSNQAEAQMLSAIPSFGWEPTGVRFPATSIAALSTDSALRPVCRFYGSVQPGPNSHFYTADPAECAELLRLQQVTPSSLPRWHFESHAFAAALPIAGKCPESRPMALRRFYNNRVAQNDSNHRYVLSEQIAAQMRSAGWIDEGIVMCTP